MRVASSRITSTLNSSVTHCARDAPSPGTTKKMRKTVCSSRTAASTTCFARMALPRRGSSRGAPGAASVASCLPA
eukprot:876030-Prymnesium_polylepis.2